MLLPLIEIGRSSPEYPDLTEDAVRWIARVGEHDMLNEDVPHVNMDVELVILHPEGDSKSIEKRDKKRQPLYIGRCILYIYCI